MEICAEKRLEQAISGRKPDRVPVSPLFYYFAARQAGITPAEILREPLKYRAAMDLCWEKFGPWDVYYPLNAVNRDMMAVSIPMKTAYPGSELPENESVQFLEEEIMTPADYDELLEPLFPVEPKRLWKALLRESRAWLSIARGALRGSDPAASLSRIRAGLPVLFKTSFGNPRDPAAELRSLALFAKTLAGLLADPSLDADVSLRYLLFILRIARRARERRSALSNAVLSLRAAYRQLDFTRGDFSRWLDRGAAILFGMGLEAPFDSFSMARSLIPFSTDDLFNRPEKIKKCSLISTDFFLAMSELGTTLTGVPRFILACHRTSNDFVSPEHFRELAFPSIRRITLGLIERGITPIFHCDGNWNLNLKYLALLPAGRCVFQFDGKTDVFLARRVLGPEHCVFGDVPAAMLAHGDRSDVERCCRRLIREVGADGRFILGAGCEVPPDAKPENVRAMLCAPYRG
ncbi:MAG: uroporphyrinogen decarboxylase family protein [bacterium]